MPSSFASILNIRLTEDGRLFRGFTPRTSRSKLLESQRADYGRYIEVTVYEPDIKKSPKWPRLVNFPDANESTLIGE